MANDITLGIVFFVTAIFLPVALKTAILLIKVLVLTCKLISSLTGFGYITTRDPKATSLIDKVHDVEYVPSAFQPA